jgi:hypothetical protein
MKISKQRYLFVYMKLWFLDFRILDDVVIWLINYYKVYAIKNVYNIDSDGKNKNIIK